MSSDQSLTAEIEKCKGNIYTLACDVNGSKYLLKLVEKLHHQKNKAEIVSLFFMLLLESRKLMALVQHSTGFRTVMTFLDFCPGLKAAFIDSLVPGFLGAMKSSEVKSFLVMIFDFFTPSELEPILQKTSLDLLSITKSTSGFNNFTVLLKESNPCIQQKVVTFLPQDFWSHCFDSKYGYCIQEIVKLENKAAGDQLISRLKGKFTDLSVHRNAHFVVQRCFQDASYNSCLLIIENLSSSFGYLVTNHYGNYVLQALIRRFLCECKQLPSALVFEIESRRQELGVNLWGNHLQTYDWG